MEIVDFLNELRSELPLLQEKEHVSFLTFLEGYFKNVSAKLKKLDSGKLFEISKTFDWDSEQLCHNFDYLTQRIIKTIKLFYDGKPASAYYHFKRNVLKVDLDESKTRYIDYFDDHGRFEPVFFRIRKKGKNQIFSVNDLFHIPFHSRPQIKPQRFSLMGHPSLYLSTSIFTCWLEMGQPSIDEFYVSRFKAKCPLIFINLSIPPCFIDVSTEDNAKKAFRFLITFPLIAASIVKVKQTESPFIPEYVIPQLLLQFIRNERYIDGIMYTTTKIQDKYNGDAWNYRNVVIPVLSNKESGYCEKLRKKFSISTPLLLDENTSRLTMMNFFRSEENKLFID